MILMSGSWIYSDCLRRSCFSLPLGTVRISGCRSVVHSGFLFRCLESRSYHYSIQHFLLHAVVISVPLLTYLKKLCKTTDTLKQTLLLAFMLHLACSSPSQSVPAFPCGWVLLYPGECHNVLVCMQSFLVPLLESFLSGSFKCCIARAVDFVS